MGVHRVEPTSVDAEVASTDDIHAEALFINPHRLLLQFILLHTHLRANELHPGSLLA